MFQEKEVKIAMKTRLLIKIEWGPLQTKFPGNMFSFMIMYVIVNQKTSHIEINTMLLAQLCLVMFLLFGYLTLHVSSNIQLELFSTPCWLQSLLLSFAWNGKQQQVPIRPHQPISVWQSRSNWTKLNDFFYTSFTATIPCPTLPWPQVSWI